MYDLTMTVYGVKCIVPVLEVPGQRDELIVGSNVLKHLMHVLKCNVDYWKLISTGGEHSFTGYEHFLDIMLCTTRWRGNEIPHKTGIVKLPHAVMLLPQQEHLVWCKISSKGSMSPGSTIRSLTLPNPDPDTSSLAG